MAAEMLLLDENYYGTESQDQDTVYSAQKDVDFEEGARNVRILSITSSGWILSKRNRAEGGSRNALPKFWVTLKGIDERVVGPLHNTVEFTGVSGLTLFLDVPHFLLANSTDRSTYRYTVIVSCCYERL